jgi:hypothetical protein
MSAPNNADRIGKDNKDTKGRDCGHFTCQCCGFTGEICELLGVDQDDDPTLWCPQCRTSAIEFDCDGEE